MLNFVKNAFRNYLGSFLWINLVIFIIGFGIVGYYIGISINNEIIFLFLGIIIGLISGIEINILFGGFIATIINIDVNIQLLKNKYVSNNTENSNINISKNEGRNTKWKCPKCNSENPNTQYNCNNCGYKLI